MKETFGQRLSRLRKEKGMTQEEIASKITISPQAVSKWENDISSPDILVLSSLADILGVSVDELLGRKNEEVSSKAEETPRVEVIDEEPQKKNKEGVHITNDGVHIVGDEGERVNITKNGVEVIDSDGTVRVKKPKDFCEEHKIDWIIDSVIAGLALIGYILLGLFWKDDNMGWKMGWLLFLLVPIVGSIQHAIRKRRICHIAYPIIVVGAYVTLGFLGSYFGFPGWEFYWFLFLTIPAFYLIFGPIDKWVIHKNDPKDEDEDDGEDEDDD